MTAAALTEQSAIHTSAQDENEIATAGVLEKLVAQMTMDDSAPSRDDEVSDIVDGTEEINEMKKSEDAIEDQGPAETQGSTSTSSDNTVSIGAENASASSDVLGISGLGFDPKVEAQTYDALRWIPILGDAYSLGRAAFFALEGDTTEAGLCAVNVIPFVGNVISTAKRVKDAKDQSGGDGLSAGGVDSANGDPSAPPTAPLPPVYTKIMSLYDEFFGSSEPDQEQSQSQCQQRPTQEQRPVHPSPSGGITEARSRRPSERPTSNNFGEEDPVLVLSQHAHEALDDIRSEVDVPAGKLEETDALRKSSTGDIINAKERSGFPTAYVSGAGLVPVMRI